MAKQIYGASNLEALLNDKVSLNESGVIPPELLPDAIIPYADKSLYYVGELNTVTNSQYWKVLADIDILLVHFDLSEPPTGTGVTTVQLLKNGDTINPLLSVEFSSGETLKTSSITLSLSAFDKVSLAITTVTNAYHGADLTVSISYRKAAV